MTTGAQLEADEPCSHHRGWTGSQVFRKGLSDAPGVPGSAFGTFGRHDATL